MTKQQRAERIIKAVANEAGVDPVTLIRTRKTAHTPHRDRMTYLLDEIGVTRIEIADLFQWANPTNGLHAIRRVIKRMQSDSDEAQIITQLRREINV